MKDKAIELKKLFNEIDPRDRNELLKWFALAYYYNDSLVNLGVYDEVYDKLCEYYLPLTEDKDALQTLKEIKQKNRRRTPKVISHIIVEQIMIGIKGKIGIDRAVRNILFNYHEKYNSEFVEELYMKMLKEYIGEEVFVSGYHTGQALLVKGTLNEVNDYNSIKVDDESYNFIGYEYYIASINDKKGTVIYYNKNSYDLSKLSAPEDIETARSVLFNHAGTKKYGR